MYFYHNKIRLRETVEKHTKTDFINYVTAYHDGTYSLANIQPTGLLESDLSASPQIFKLVSGALYYPSDAIVVRKFEGFKVPTYLSHIDQKVSDDRLLIGVDADNASTFLNILWKLLTEGCSEQQKKDWRKRFQHWRRKAGGFIVRDEDAKFMSSLGNVNIMYIDGSKLNAAQH